MKKFSLIKIFSYKDISKFLEIKKRLRHKKPENKFFFEGFKKFLKNKNLLRPANLFWTVFLILFFWAFFATFPSLLIKAKFFIFQMFKGSQIEKEEKEILQNIQHINNSKENNSSSKILPAAINEEEIKNKNILYIPSVGIKTEIIVMPELGKIPSEAEVQYYLKKGIVLYPHTARPGEIGNVVIFGHSSRYLWESGRYKYIFTLLDEVKINDLIYIFWNNQTFIYLINEKKVIEPTNIEVTYSTNESILSLITCTPYSKRLLVRAQQVYPNPLLNKVPNHPLLPKVK